VTLVPSLHGQQRQTVTAQTNPDLPDSCSHQFTVGGGNNSLQDCALSYRARPQSSCSWRDGWGLPLTNVSVPF
jgi:Tfp pilus assembly protein PilW